MRGLIGATGFVGSALLRHAEFESLYSSSNLEEIRGREFDLLVCAAPSSGKWRANQDPELDATSVDRLMAALRTVSAGCFVLVSTIDVYPNPVDVDEDSHIDEMALRPYGLHRRRLEQYVASQFSLHLIVRAPAVFGQGLRKNAIFDLLRRDVRFIHPASELQFYDIERAWSDIGVALAAKLNVLNLAVEPISIREVATRVFDLAIPEPSRPAETYDMRTKHAGRFGRESVYLATAAEVLHGLSAFATAAANGA
jgi:nucleoside-diphosphate-sugar epimerase